MGVLKFWKSVTEILKFWKSSINVLVYTWMTSIRLPSKRFIEKHPQVWQDNLGRHWLLQSSFKPSSEVAYWQESSDWDDAYELCFGVRAFETDGPVIDDVVVVRRGSETMTITVEELLIPRGFKWAALITINRRS